MPEVSPPLNDSLAFLIHDLARLMRRRLSAAIVDLDLSPSRARILSFLFRAGRLPQGALAELLDIQKAPLASNLAWMEAVGLISRETVAGDRRCRTVSLAAKATPVIESLRARSQALEQDLLTELDEGERRELRTALMKVRDELAVTSEPVGMRRADDSFFWILVGTARSISRRFDEQLAGIGMTRPQWLVLSAAATRNGARQVELASVVDLAPAPLGKVVDQLETEGWLRRTSDPADRRARLVHLSADGAERIQDVRAQFNELHSTLEDGFTQQQSQWVRRTLQRLRTRLINRKPMEEAS